MWWPAWPWITNVLVRGGRVFNPGGRGGTEQLSACHLYFDFAGALVFWRRITAAPQPAYALGPIDVCLPTEACFPLICVLLSSLSLSLSVYLSFRLSIRPSVRRLSVPIGSIPSQRDVRATPG